MSTAINLAITSLRRNTGRTLLTVLGIVIGIMAVIVVLSAGQAIKGLIVGEVQNFGSNFLEIEVKTPQTKQTSTENAMSMVGGSVITTLKLDDAEAVARHPNISLYYAGIMGQKLATYESEMKKALLFGTSADFINIDTAKIAAGRFFSDAEDQSLAKVAVLGYKISNNLFHDQYPINENIQIGKEKFKVVGTLIEKGASFGMDMDNMIFLPVQTLQKRLLGVDYVSFIIAQMIDPSQGDTTALELTDIMRQQHKIDDPNKDDFAIITMEQMLEMMDVILYGIQILLIALGSISLIVGGVGIMNIMYVSVTERTFEIGLRKSLGAKKRDILWQFLFEAIILTFSGAVIGVILGVAVAYLLYLVAANQGLKWDFSISITGLMVAFVMSTAVGLIFGLYPAKKAAGMNPIEALRRE
ncbi:hypothetical protein A2482_03625 [Candidatus Falkowbacteria bacterium RIFOXYC2_FULL_48_21]|uniref:Multidrug ABC transporter substrate-binding protein n=1 Tax=Candidatus Falkowbacteria bacterium RIFOXYC2_FULL_48_21 TaxID=1798005 RepID=A0A1F5TBK5_9BACT|nr:MAG: hypothetical protein A2482_03625 [Candidatus Falkowbacteria bacterium RIFOXYC2_FULL_48_21]